MDSSYFSFIFLKFLNYVLFQVSVQPFILRSQLYSSVKDRTQVDRELEVCDIEISFVANTYVMMFLPKLRRVAQCGMDPELSKLSSYKVL